MRNVQHVLFCQICNIATILIQTQISVSIPGILVVELAGLISKWQMEDVVHVRYSIPLELPSYLICMKKQYMSINCSFEEVQFEKDQ